MVRGRVVVFRSRVASVEGRADRRQLGGGGRRGWAVVLMGGEIGVMERQRRWRGGRVVRPARAEWCLRGGRLGLVVSNWFPWLVWRSWHSVSQEAFLLVDRSPRHRVAEHVAGRHAVRALLHE